jgi:hypothetical protein
LFFKNQTIGKILRKKIIIVTWNPAIYHLAIIAINILEFEPSSIFLWTWMSLLGADHMRRYIGCLAQTLQIEVFNESWLTRFSFLSSPDQEFGVREHRFGSRVYFYRMGLDSS